MEFLYLTSENVCFYFMKETSENVIQHRWAVANFNSYFSFHKLKSNSDSLLGICLLLKKIIHLLMFYVISHVVPGLLTFLYGLLTGKYHRKA